MPSAASGNQELQHAGSPASSARCSLLAFFQMLASDDVQGDEAVLLCGNSRFLRSTSTDVQSLVLRGLLTLTEGAKMVSTVVSGTDVLALGL